VAEDVSEGQGDEGDESSGRYKVVEVGTVTDEALESVLNEWTEQGYVLEGMHFAMRESSKRPAMAFLVFSRRS
jgi:hypothetical protein